MRKLFFEMWLPCVGWLSQDPKAYSPNSYLLPPCTREAFTVEFRAGPSGLVPNSSCSMDQVLQRYADEGMSFLEKVIADSSILEDVSCVCHHNTENHTNRNDAGTSCDKENMQDSFTASLIVTTNVSRDSMVALRKLSLRLPSGYRQQRVQIILLCSEG